MSDRELDLDEQRLFSALPREMPLDPTLEDRVVAALRSERFFLHGTSRRGVALRASLVAMLLLAVSLASAALGARLATRNSLEVMVGRPDLSVGDRVLLLQRAGSAYVRAAHAYADGTQLADSSAVEVARQVLLGAAHAVVRSRLDAGVASRLTTLLQTPAVSPTRSTRNIIWF
jgi:hypothetical protein